MKINKNLSLRPHNTFAVDVKADIMYLLENDVDISIALDKGLFNSPFFIMGAGSNLLFTRNMHEPVIQMNNHGIELLDEQEEQVILKVAAGEQWNDFVNYCIRHQYYGVENLIGIPGLVGSSPVQNIGAYGVEVKDLIYEVHGVNLKNGLPFAFDKKNCQFDYRSSIFKTQLKQCCLITNVLFTLSKKEHYTLTYKGLKDELNNKKLPFTLENVSSVVESVRNSKLPDITKIGCAGSFFKNPIVSDIQLKQLLVNFPQLIHYKQDNGCFKMAAGQLIDLCGWKGKRIGDVGVYPLQALVIVNYGNANGNAIVQVYKKIQSDVFDKFGVMIEPEVNIIC